MRVRKGQHLKAEGKCLSAAATEWSVTRDQTPGTNLIVSHIHVLLTSLGQHVPLKDFFLAKMGFSTWKNLEYLEQPSYIYIYTYIYIYVCILFSKPLLPNFLSIIISPQLLSDKTRLGANGLGAKGAQLAAELALKMKLHRALVGCLVSFTSFRGCVELRLFFWMKRNVFQRNVKQCSFNKRKVTVNKIE